MQHENSERYRIPAEYIDRAIEFLSGLGFTVTREKGITNLKSRGCTLSIYDNGTVIAHCSGVLEKVVRDYILSVPFSYEDYLKREFGIEANEEWMGTDEAGKGDYFGPLVVACVCVTLDEAEMLYRLGLADSKRLAESELFRFNSIIESMVRPSHREIINISPSKYNELRESLGNINSILAWAHSRAIEQVAKRSNARMAIVDKFLSGSNEGIRVQGVFVHEFNKAERDMAVASASVLAAVKFREEMDEISRLCGFRVPRGAGADASALARRLREEKGEEFCRRVCKMNFKL